MQPKKSNSTNFAWSFPEPVDKKDPRAYQLTQADLEKGHQVGVVNLDNYIRCNAPKHTAKKPTYTPDGSISLESDKSSGGFVVVLIHSASHSSADSNLLSLPSQPP